jgi:hypothetical protein
VYRELKVPAVTVGDDIVVPPLAGAAAPDAARPAAYAPPVADAAAAPATVPAPDIAAAPVAPPQSPQSRVQPPKQSPAPPPAPASPAAPAGGSAGRRKANDVFLSAKDLAAAFQLDFKPDADSEPGVADAAYSRSVAAGADTALPWPPRRRPRRRVGRTILLLLLLAAGASGAALALSPTFRRQAADWANNKYQSLTGADLYPDIGSPGQRPRATTAPAATPQRQIQPPAPRPPTPTPVVTTPARDAGATAAAGVMSRESMAPAAASAGPRGSEQAPPLAQGQVVRPRQEPAAPPSVATEGPAGSEAGAAGPPVGTRPPAATRPIAAATRPAVVATQPAAAPAPAVPKLTLQDAQQKAKAWYGQALDADADGDLAGATRLYRRIMDELPPKIDGQDVWPSDVKLRYEEAVKVLGAK